MNTGFSYFRSTYYSVGAVIGFPMRCVNKYGAFIYILFTFFFCKDESLVKMNPIVWWALVNVFLVLGVSGVGADEESVSVKEGDSVTLHTNIEANQQETMRWYFNGILIAKINGEKREICSDDCKERFRDRLELDQTGSLTITNTRTTDSGPYQLNIINTGSFSDKIFSVSVHGVSAAERDEMKTKSVKEGESVSLDPGVIKNPNDVMKWYFKDSLIAEITGDQSKICSDDECKERFRDRLKLDHQTGSLTITNITNTDSGDYTLQIIISSSSFSIRRISTVLTVIAVPVSGLYSVAGAGIGVLLLIITAAVAAAAVFLYRKYTQNNRDQGIELKDVPRDQSITPCIPPVVNASNVKS